MTIAEDVLFSMDCIGLDQIFVTREMYRRAELEGFPADKMVVVCFLDQGVSDSPVKQKESIKGPRNRWGGVK